MTDKRPAWDNPIARAVITVLDTVIAEMESRSNDDHLYEISVGQVEGEDSVVIVARGGKARRLIELMRRENIALPQSLGRESVAALRAKQQRVS